MMLENFSNLYQQCHYNRHDLRNYLLATEYIGRSIKKNLNSVVTGGKLNDAIVRHELDTRDKYISADPNPLQVTFKDKKIRRTKFYYW